MGGIRVKAFVPCPGGPAPLSSLGGARARMSLGLVALALSLPEGKPSVLSLQGPAVTSQNITQRLALFALCAAPCHCRGEHGGHFSKPAFKCLLSPPQPPCSTTFQPWPREPLVAV